MTRTGQRFVAAVLAGAGLLIGLFLVLKPLPTLNALGGPVGWCGPGATSSNALEMLVDPDEALGLSNATLSESDDGALLASFCMGKAKESATAGLGSAGLGLVLALAVFLVRPRDMGALPQ